MSSELNLPLILMAAFMTSASPGPATLAIAGTSMESGRKHGLALAAGIMTGSLIWSTAAALGFGALMLANAWAFEIIRYVGAAYLLYLGFRSARSAMRAGDPHVSVVTGTFGKIYAKGLALHLTNPKAILFFGSLYAIGLPPDATPTQIVTVVAAIGTQSFLIFHGYALLFSNRAMTRTYQHLRRWFDSVFALAFGYAGIKVLTARLQ
ncbi:MAG: LysE family translocator [Rhodospirillales bacterium]|nr:LysE family translocator [Rhodospirillales bacterium]